MIDNEQVAHGLALAYINNRYGAEVKGSFGLNDEGDDVLESISTDRLPSADLKETARVPTGE